MCTHTHRAHTHAHALTCAHAHRTHISRAHTSRRPQVDPQINTVSDTYASEEYLSMGMYLLLSKQVPSLAAIFCFLTMSHQAIGRSDDARLLCTSDILRPESFPSIGPNTAMVILITLRGGKTDRVGLYWLHFWVDLIHLIYFIDSFRMDALSTLASYATTTQQYAL
jgi:hypothetical protein